MSVRESPARAWIRTGISVFALVSGLITPISAAHAQSESLNILRDTEIEAILHEEMDPVFAAAKHRSAAGRARNIVGDDTMNAETGTGYNMIVTMGLIACRPRRPAN